MSTLYLSSSLASLFDPTASNAYDPLANLESSFAAVATAEETYFATAINRRGSYNVASTLQQNHLRRQEAGLRNAQRNIAFATEATTVLTSAEETLNDIHDLLTDLAASATPVADAPAVQLQVDQLLDTIDAEATGSTFAGRATFGVQAIRDVFDAGIDWTAAAPGPGVDDAIGRAFSHDGSSAQTVRLKLGSLRTFHLGSATNVLSDLQTGGSLDLATLAAGGDFSDALDVVEAALGEVAKQSAAVDAFAFDAESNAGYLLTSMDIQAEQFSRATELEQAEQTAIDARAKLKADAFAAATTIMYEQKMNLISLMQPLF